MIINLRDFYPFYMNDEFINVPDEIGAVLLESDRLERNYINRLIYHKAYYSLDRNDGIENATLDKPHSPEETYLGKLEKARLYAALAQLPDKQAKRLYAFYFLSMSKTEIALAEGVSESSVFESISRGLKNLKKSL